MLPTELTGGLKKGLATIRGQIEAIVKMLDEENDLEKILIQFKAADQGLQKHIIYYWMKYSGRALL